MFQQCNTDKNITMPYVVFFFILKDNFNLCKVSGYKRKGTIIRCKIKVNQKKKYTDFIREPLSYANNCLRVKMIKTRFIFCNMQSHVQSIEQTDGQCDSIQKYKNGPRRKADIPVAFKGRNTLFTENSSIKHKAKLF